MSELTEHERRKPGAEGTVVTLTDGRPWLLANPTFRPGERGLTRPQVDRPLERIFESVVLGERLSPVDVLEVARGLLKANYDVSDEEAAQLLSFFQGEESRALAGRVLDALFGSDLAEKSYTSWVRASLFANGLNESEIPARDLVNVLAILIATDRTIPLSKFADACLRLDERARLETLI